MGMHAVEHLREVRRRPAFRCPLRPGGDRDHRARQRDQFLPRRTHFSRLERDAEHFRLVPDAELLCHGPHTIDRVRRSQIRAPNLVRVGEPAPLAGVREPHADRRPTRARHNSAAQKALHVDHEIEPAAAQFPAETPQSADRAKPLEGGPVERERVREVRVPGQERLARLVHHPGNAGVREPLPQGRENGERMDDVAERARLDDRDAAGLHPVERHAESLPEQHFTTKTQRSHKVSQS